MLQDQEIKNESIVQKASITELKKELKGVES